MLVSNILIKFNDEYFNNEYFLNIINDIFLDHVVCSQ